MPSQPFIATGAQYKKFYIDDAVWNPDRRTSWYVEEDELTVDGERVADPSGRFGDTMELLADDAQVQVTGGWMGWQGEGEDPSQDGGMDLADTFQTWCKAQTTLTLVATVEVPADLPAADLERLVAQLRGLGATVKGFPEPGTGGTAPKP